MKKYSNFLFGIKAGVISMCISAAFIATILTGCSMNSDDGDSTEKQNAENQIEDSYDLSDYEETFCDDFNGSELDLTKWERCPEWQRQDHGGYWRNECSYIQEGNLVLEARRGTTLESGAIRSRGKFMQNGGAYQIRFKAEKKSGLWSAFWLMYSNSPDTDGRAANDGEIDIFEIISNDNGSQYLNSAVHWDGYSQNHKMNSSKYPIRDDFFDNWHTVTFFWGSKYYEAFLDDADVPFWKGNVSRYGGTASSDHYIKITSEFGTWGGPVTSTTLPSYFYVDWVKAYRRKPAQN